MLMDNQLINGKIHKYFLQQAQLCFWHKGKNIRCEEYFEIQAITSVTNKAHFCQVNLPYLLLLYAPSHYEQ